MINNTIKAYVFENDNGIHLINKETNELVDLPEGFVITALDYSFENGDTIQAERVILDYMNVI